MKFFANGHLFAIAFHKTTQYGPKYVIGRNCRFLQGPRTNPYSVRRIEEAIAAEREHQEIILN
jgi:hypothetical protein